MRALPAAPGVRVDDRPVGLHASFDDAEAIRPSLHYRYSQHLAGLRVDGALPRYPESPPDSTHPPVE